MDESLSSGKLGHAAAFKRQQQALLKQQQDIRSKTLELKSSYDLLIQKLQLIEEEEAEAADYKTQLNGQIAKLTELESKSSQQAELATLKKLVILNESLKNQEAAFKTSCKNQMQDYRNRMEAFNIVDDDNSEENQKFREIEDMHTKVMAKYNRLRQMLAEVNLEVASASRTIDDVPTRTELIQYERRFGELYQQVAWKLEETRKYYDLYNTLETTYTFIQKEVVHFISLLRRPHRLDCRSNC